MTRKVCALLFLWLATSSHSYGQRGRGPETVSTNLTGLSLVTEDWRWRMVTPAKGDYTSVPLNPAGRRIADAWDPAKDKATGEECKAYGAPAIMRVPGRLHITQPDATTIRIDTDAGIQTRLLHLGNLQPSPQEATWQGYSVAQWESGNATRGTGGRGTAAASGSLKVSTTGMRPGYLRKNGIPYSANAALTEYFTAFTEPDGNAYLVVMSIVNDAQYLTQPFITSTHFRKERDNAGWDPQPCSSQ